MSKQALTGPAKTVAKLQRSNERQALNIAGLNDKNANLRYEVARLERALIAVYLHPEHAKDIAARVIPRVLAQHGHRKLPASEEGKGNRG